MRITLLSLALLLSLTLGRRSDNLRSKLSKTPSDNAVIHVKALPALKWECHSLMNAEPSTRWVVDLFIIPASISNRHNRTQNPQWGEWITTKSVKSKNAGTSLPYATTILIVASYTRK
jgi:hypothetical protein